MYSEFTAFVTDDKTLETTSAWAERQGFPADSVQKGGADLFATMLESETPPRLALVDIDGQERPDRAIARLSGLCGVNTRLVALGSANDVSLYRSMQAAGVADYLVKPLTAEALTQSLILSSRGAADGTSKEARVILMMGVRGGVGTSTTAANIGWIVAHEMKRKCVLLDLDLQFGTNALALDLEPGHGLRDVVSSPQRVDALMIAGATANEHDHFAVLSAEEAIDEVVHVDGAAMMALLKELRLSHQIVIIDMPRHLLPTQKRLLALAHDIVLVTEMSLAGIRDTLRVRTMLKSLGCTGRITVVAPRVGTQRPGAVDEATFTKGAQGKIDFTLPDDPKSVIAASNAGKMLGAVASSAPLTKTLRQLAKYLMEQPSGEVSKEKPTKGLLDALLGTKPKTRGKDKT